MEHECIICKVPADDSLSEASENSLKTITSFCEDWAKLGKHKDVLGRVKCLTFSDDIKHHYHRKCYQSLCHRVNLARAQKKHEKDIITAAANKKRGRASDESSSSKTRKVFDQELCVFCQKDDKSALHSVTSRDMGKKFVAIKASSKSEEIRARLAFINNDQDAFAQNLKYHINCLRKETRLIESPITASYTISERDNIAKAICDIEIAKIVEYVITNDSESEFPSTDMNTIQDTYTSLLKESGVALNPDTNYKPHIKNILIVEIPGIDFAKRGPKAEIVFSKLVKEKIMTKCYEAMEVVDDMEVLFKASQIIRREVSEMKDWNFIGKFSDFTTPIKLQQLMKWVISGPHTSLNITRELQTEASSRNLAQHIISAFRSRRQVTYETKTDSRYHKTKRTPLSVGLALTSYQASRSRSDIETLNDIQLSVTYDDVERMTTRMAMAIMDDIKDNTQGVHIPPFVKHGIMPLFAIDNIDLGSDAGSFHGADLLIAQREEEGVPLLGRDLKLDIKVQDKSLKRAIETTYYDCAKPTPSTSSDTSYRLNTMKEMSTDFDQNNTTWLLMCSQVVTQLVDSFADDDVVTDEVHVSVEEQAPVIVTPAADELPSISQACSDSSFTQPQARSQVSPTWATFNSLLTHQTPKWNVGIAAPLYRRSPTEWPVLLTILKQAQQINTSCVGEGHRPIITLDGDLYDRAVKLKDYKTHWCIRLGALHTTMAALKCLGKYTEGSGLDMAWEAAGIYGSATVRQILDGRHIYRCIEAHTITLIAIFCLYLQLAFSDKERIELMEQINPAVDAFRLYADGKKGYNSEQFKSQVHEVQQVLSVSNVFERLNDRKGHVKGIQKFLINYMNQVEVLLTFIAATRTCNWRLHLAKMEELLPYFHAHDHYNYGRWGPLYVADMLELQRTDPETWKFLDDGNFAITKHSVPFTAIDPDHCIEQEHRKMKIKGGFIGITGNEHALDKYFIIAPTLCKLVEEFKDYAGIQPRMNSSIHHEVVGEKSHKLLVNAAKIIKTITKQGNPFLKSDMFNLVTFAVVPANICCDIEDRDNFGREALERFVTTRMIEQTIKFWDSQKKNKRSYFKDVGATVKTKVSGQVVTIKQERALLSRFLVAARSRPDFIIKEAIGDFEFNVASPSNFNPDGSMIMQSDKSQVVSSIFNIPLPEASVVLEAESGVPSVLIIDAMCIVNMVTKTPDMSNAMHFAMKFVEIVAGISKPTYDEIRVVFDQYIPGSLKETTRDKRTCKTPPIHYHVHDGTDIKNIKAFLSHIKTKAELTKYLSDKLIKYYQGKSQKVVVIHHTVMEATCPLSDVVSMPEMTPGQHHLEEGDQLVLLNAFDVMHKNPHTTLDIFSVDTDVFVLLTGHFPLLPKSTTLLRKKGERISIHESYLRLGPKKAEALIGWYTFKGTDNTGSFAGKGVLTHFKAFLQSDDDILDAFSTFGLVNDLPNGIIDQMERYLCLLYKTGGISECTLRELRWALFAQKGKEGQQLPPTLGTLIPHTYRAFYMARVWKLSQKPCPQIPSPTNYYWESVDGRLRPVCCINPPAPEALLELRKCNCKKGCEKRSCGCQKNNLRCTDMCGCGDECKNMAPDRPLETEETDLDQ